MDDYIRLTKCAKRYIFQNTVTLYQSTFLASLDISCFSCQLLLILSMDVVVSRAAKESRARDYRESIYMNDEL